MESGNDYMRIAMLIPPKDFKDESVSSAKSMLVKWGVEVVITSYSTKACRGYHGAVYNPELNAGRIKSADFDGILLIDGPGVDSYKLYDFRPLLDTLSVFANSGKIIAGIDNAVKIIARANVVSDLKVATPKDEETKRLVQLYHGKVSDNGLEDQRNIITLSDPEKIGTLLEAILKKLGAK